MSLGVVSVSRALNHVVEEVTDAGIHIAVSAGNDSKDACKQSPASAPPNYSRFYRKKQVMQLQISQTLENVLTFSPQFTSANISDNSDVKSVNKPSAAFYVFQFQK
ncbi:hypothetical protein C1646_759202 [Rhizophagus diaphanus]|nr:hypothetical protein C1646_759202 [Rhizophagus diaphanus] [Rhizophagus sp. MUCL 43196]